MAYVHCKFFSGMKNMNAAGIDVSSRKSTVTVLHPFGEVRLLKIAPHPLPISLKK